MSVMVGRDANHGDSDSMYRLSLLTTNLRMAPMSSAVFRLLFCVDLLVGD